MSFCTGKFGHRAFCMKAMKGLYPLLNCPACTGFEGADAGML